MKERGLEIKKRKVRSDRIDKIKKKVNIKEKKRCWIVKKWKLKVKKKFKSRKRMNA